MHACAHALMNTLSQLAYRYNFLLFITHPLVMAITIDQLDSNASRSRGAKQALKNIQEGRISSPQPPVTSQPARPSTGKGWLKKLTEGYVDFPAYKTSVFMVSHKCNII